MMNRRRANLLFVPLAVCLLIGGGCRNPGQVEHSVPSLLKTLKEDKDPNMRYYAAQSLGRFGAEAQAAVPDLVVALKDDSALVRSGAAYALGEIGDADGVPALKEATKDPEKDVREAAAFALKQIQQKGKKR
jgi:HEAT repeat protein